MPVLFPLSLIVALPLAGFLVIGLFGSRWPKPWAGIAASAFTGLAFVVAVNRFLQLATLAPDLRSIHEFVYTWIDAGTFSVDVSWLLDPLSAVMILVVTGVGFLIHVYSIGYMQEDHNDAAGRNYARYFCYLNLFIAFMSTLVLADNYLLMFVGWEGVGLCSYFLIGFWMKREDASEASKKAFIVNRIGDFGFILGLLLLFQATGTLAYKELFAIAHNNPQMLIGGTVGALGGITTITLLLTLGATGKSAQIPLFVWLPDAMAGPTPVSALIHAATMVTAGVYMIARSAPLFELAPDTRLIVCGVGAATALCAGLTALAHNDIKKVLAYSTVSQLGFMFMGVGAGAYAAAIFHVFTHAFFKACLFLGSGSVIHALHGEQDMRKMGGLARRMSITNITFLLAGLALAGAFPLAGFFSKDEIIASVLRQGGANPVYLVCGVVGLLTALITALYTGRQYAQIFLGEGRDHHLVEHAHESPPVMTLPLVILAAGSVVAGIIGLPHLPGVPAFGHAFATWLAPAGETLREPDASLGLLALGAVIGWGGWWAGRALGLGAGRAFLEQPWNQISLDSAYRQVVVPVGFAFAEAQKWIDENLVDGLVNGIASVIAQAGQAFRLTQTAYVRNYALSMTMGAAIVVGMFLWMLAQR